MSQSILAILLIVGAVAVYFMFKRNSFKPVDQDALKRNIDKLDKIIDNQKKELKDLKDNYEKKYSDYMSDDKDKPS